MTRMELWRKKEREVAELSIGTDRRDYLSFHRVVGFIAGSAFYAVAVVAAGAVALSVYFTNLSRTFLIGFLLAAVIGYIIFMFFYQRWYYNYCAARYQEAKRQAGRQRRDWDTLNRIYEEEDEAAKPTVDMDLLFPEGSLGENE